MKKPFLFVLLLFSLTQDNDKEEQFVIANDNSFVVVSIGQINVEIIRRHISQNFYQDGANS